MNRGFIEIPKHELPIRINSGNYYCSAKHLHGSGCCSVVCASRRSCQLCRLRDSLPASPVAPPSGFGISADEVVRHCSEWVQATNLPVNTDFEDGYSRTIDGLVGRVAPRYRCIGPGQLHVLFIAAGLSFGINAIRRA